MDSPICQTFTASPAEPGASLCRLGLRPIDRRDQIGKHHPPAHHVKAA